MKTVVDTFSRFSPAVDPRFDGPLLGETVVFIGSLSIPRRDAADLAHMAGGAVEPGVTKAATVLVVGDHDLLRTGGKPKSSKHLKAESLAAKGQPIRFLADRGGYRASARYAATLAYFPVQCSSRFVQAWYLRARHRRDL
ncbi:BRCT domain-containing protein [Aquamicrobium sp. LC103]|uniref:BRCT domain-containing protein n=1 Tax=Aquamicrobium sp. LC103 TaxID=1120658 RepID=UPI00109D593D|nr:BRCT domain-containing protein [Aquamicrobium sp. LC103]TKT75705.1 hypothetical protein XW59_017800 [Aquamicrobium sp. LC103]